MDSDAIAALIPSGQTLLFWVKRSTNRNVIVYVASGDASGGVSVDAYWLMFEKAAEGGVVPTEPLTSMERRMAYGFTVDAEGCLSLAALPSRKLPIGGSPLRAHLDGGSEIVEGLFVQMKRGIVPRVDYVQVHLADGTTRTLSA